MRRELFLNGTGKGFMFPHISFYIYQGFEEMKPALLDAVGTQNAFLSRTTLDTCSISKLKR